MPRPETVAGKGSAISCLTLMLSTCLSLASFGCGGGQGSPVSPHSGQLTIQPASVNLSMTGTQQFTVSGAPAGAAVSWAVNGTAGGNATMGIISPSGLYKAPATVPAGTITVSATVAGSTVAAPTATVTVIATGPLTISPSPVTVLLLGTQQFQVSGMGSGSVTWSVNQIAGGNPTVGTISGSGLYTPPLTVPSGLVEVEATSQNPSATAKSAVTLQYPSVTISAITPTQIPAGTAFQNLTLTGTGFGSFSQITINGVAAVLDPASPFTPTQFTIQVPQPLMVFATILLIQANNPTPGGGQAVATAHVVGGPPSMLTPRSDHTATLLNNGKVLIAGGSNVSAAGLNGLNTAELYDPVAKTFAASHGTMSTTRTRHTATLLLDGTVLLAGGDNSTTVTTADIYDPSTDSFHATAGHMTTVRASGHSAVRLPNGKVLIAGGDYPPTNQGSPGTAEIFDPTTGTFTATGAMNEFREAPSVTLLQDSTVLVAGGGAGVSGIDQVSLNSAESYNPASGTFTLVSPMAVARAYHTATLLNDGSVLIAGGEQRHGCCMPLPYTEVYLPASKSFSTVGSMAFPRVFHTATLLATGSVHVIGGGDAITEIYSPTQAGFLQSVSLQLPRTNHTATLLPNNGGILVCGGILPSLELGNVVTASCEIVP